MPYYTAVAGTVITAANWNANVRDQGVPPFASAAARDSAITSPIVGMLAAITSNDKNEGLSQRNTAGQWRPPWNLPWPCVAYAISTAGSTGTTGTTDWSGLTTGAFTAVSNRLYLTIAAGVIGSTSSGEEAGLVIADGGSVQKQIQPVNIASATYGEGVMAMLLEAGLTGSNTRKVRVKRISALGTVSGTAAADQPAFIAVLDLGPIGVPA